MNNSFISNFKFPWRGRKLSGLFLLPVILGLVFLAGSKYEPLGKFLLYGSANHTAAYQGDLYEINLIQKFKHDFKIHDLKPAAPIGQARFIAMGDSFFYLGLDSEPVFNFLQNSLAGGVFYQQQQEGITPKSYLKESGFKPGTAKFFIWETVERSSLYRARALSSDENPPSINQGKLQYLKSSAVSLANKLGPYLSIFRPDKPRVEYLVRNNLLVKPLLAWLKNKDFEWFSDVENDSPLYSTNPDMLFFKDEVSFHNDSGKIAQINRAADSIAQEAALLKQGYGLQLVYVPIPDKLSIYYGAVQLPNTYSYDGYLPLLEKALAVRGVVTVDVYESFVRYRKTNPDALLYYPGDTHFTPLAKTIMETELVKILDRLPN